MGERDDQQLIAAYRAGDDAAFGRIHERHHAALERYARKVLGRSSEHAEDVVQEAMLRASRALRRDERHIELRPWLYRLTRNTALDELARVRNLVRATMLRHPAPACFRIPCASELLVAGEYRVAPSATASRPGSEVR